MPKIGQGQALGQPAGTAHLDPIGVDLHEDVGAFEEPVAVHYGVGDRFTDGSCRVLRDVLPPQPLDPVCGTGVALDKTKGIFDVGHHTAVEVLAVEDVDLVRALRQQTGDVCLGEEVADVPGEEEHAGVAEEQPIAGPLGRLDVNEHVLRRHPFRNAGKAEPSVELLAVEVLRVAEPRTGRQVEADHPLGAKEVADFATAELLGGRTLTPEETIAALHRLAVTLAHVDCEHTVHWLDQHVHGRVTVAGNVLDAGAKRIGILDADHGTVIAHAEKDPAPDGIGQGHEIPRERR